MALAIKISNPSKFFVYPAYTTAVIVINYKTIHNGLYGEIGVLENLNDRAFLAVNNNNLTISHDSAYWNIIKVGNNVLIKNLETGKYIKHAGNYMDNGFTLGTYDSSDVFLLNIDEVSAHYNLNGYKAYVIGDKHITTCIDSYGNGTIGAWSYSEAVQGIFPNRVWVFFDK